MISKHNFIKSQLQESNSVDAHEDEKKFFFRSVNFSPPERHNRVITNTKGYKRK